MFSLSFVHAAERDLELGRMPAAVPLATESQKHIQEEFAAGPQLKGGNAEDALAAGAGCAGGILAVGLIGASITLTVYDFIYGVDHDIKYGARCVLITNGVLNILSILNGCATASSQR